jgi:FixJ family two-component response regulator
MPRLTGKQFVDRFIALSPSTRVLVMSGYLDSQHGNGDAPFGDSFLSKPFRPLDLARSVRRTLDG